MTVDPRLDVLRDALLELVMRDNDAAMTRVRDLIEQIALTPAEPPVISDWPKQSIDLDYSMQCPGQGTGRIQWKGTDVCMDVDCVCGHHGHIDTEFLYFYRCPKCDQVFVVGTTVRLYACSPEMDKAHRDRAKSPMD